MTRYLDAAMTLSARRAGRQRSCISGQTTACRARDRQIPRGESYVFAALPPRAAHPIGDYCTPCATLTFGATVAPFPEER
jgi:hypothetical protein